MNKIKITYRNYLKTVALVVVCVFMANNVLWADPGIAQRSGDGFFLQPALYTWATTDEFRIEAAVEFYLRLLSKDFLEEREIHLYPRINGKCVHLYFKPESRTGNKIVVKCYVDEKEYIAVIDTEENSVQVSPASNSALRNDGQDAKRDLPDEGKKGSGESGDTDLDKTDHITSSGKEKGSGYLGSGVFLLFFLSLLFIVATQSGCMGVLVNNPFWSIVIGVVIVNGSGFLANWIFLKRPAKRAVKEMYEGIKKQISSESILPSGAAKEFTYEKYMEIVEIIKTTGSSRQAVNTVMKRNLFKTKGITRNNIVSLIRTVRERLSQEEEAGRFRIGRRGYIFINVILAIVGGSLGYIVRILFISGKKFAKKVSFYFGEHTKKDSFEEYQKKVSSDVMQARREGYTPFFVCEGVSYFYEIDENRLLDQMKKFSEDVDFSSIPEEYFHRQVARFINIISEDPDIQQLYRTKEEHAIALERHLNRGGKVEVDMLDSRGQEAFTVPHFNFLSSMGARIVMEKEGLHNAVRRVMTNVMEYFAFYRLAVHGDLEGFILANSEKERLEMETFRDREGKIKGQIEGIFEDDSVNPWVFSRMGDFHSGMPDDYRRDIYDIKTWHSKIGDIHPEQDEMPFTLDYLHKNNLSGEELRNWCVSYLISLAILNAGFSRERDARGLEFIRNILSRMPIERQKDMLDEVMSKRGKEEETADVDATLMEIFRDIIKWLKENELTQPEIRELEAESGKGLSGRDRSIEFFSFVAFAGLRPAVDMTGKVVGPSYEGGEWGTEVQVETEYLPQADEEDLSGERDKEDILRNIAQQEETALCLLEEMCSLGLNKEVIFVFEEGLALYQTGEPLARFLESLQNLKRNKRYERMLKNLTVVVVPPEDISSNIREYAERNNAEVFVFTRWQERDSLKEVENNEQVHPAYIMDEEFISDAYYPLAEIVVITLAQYISPIINEEEIRDILWTRDGPVSLNDLNIESISRDKKCLVFKLIPNAEPCDKQALVKKYAVLKRFLRAA